MTTSIQSKTSDSESDNPKLVRDTFSMPDTDYQLIAEILERLPALTARSTKSEIVRAGLKVLHNMDDKDLSRVLTQVQRLKTGRPTKKG
jgi:hypothetical protein